MLSIVGTMLLGILTGYLLRNRNVQFVQKLITVVIWVLLFLLGIAVGVNQEIMNHLDTIGLQAIVLAFGGVLGSVVFAWVIYRYFFQEENHTVSK